jgi:hypothetical protein
MNTTYTATELADTIANMSANFATRKVTADDIANTASRETVVAVATDLVNAYEGDFPYMLNMKSYLHFGLTDAQVAGVLNCAIADYRYNQKRTAVKQAEAIVTQPQRTYDHSTQVVADGWYTIVGPKGGHRTLRLQTVQDDKSDGVKQWLAYLSGSDNEGDYTSIGFIHGNEVSLFRKNEGKYSDIVAAARFLVRNAANIGEYGKQYALRSGKCYVCNRKLTTPESIAAGIGPVCAAK